MKSTKYSVSENSNITGWNYFVEKNNSWSLFQSEEWGQVQVSLGRQVGYYSVYKGTQKIGEFQAVLVKAKRGTHLHIRQGPVIAEAYIKDHNLWKILIEFFASLARKQKAWFVRLNPMIAKSEQLGTLFREFGLVPSPIHAMDAQYCWVLDLRVTEEILLSDMRKSTRYMIRQAQKIGVKVEISSDITTFLNLYRETSSRHHFVSHTGIKEEFEVFQTHQMADLWLASYEGQVISGALILYFGDQAIYHHGASIPSKTGASALLQWEAIKRAKKRQLVYYNFWGIAPDGVANHPWKNITLFKTGFGGKSMEFELAYDVPLSSFYQLTSLIERIRKARRGY